MHAKHTYVIEYTHCPHNKNTYKIKVFGISILKNYDRPSYVSYVSIFNLTVCNITFILNFACNQIQKTPKNDSLKIRKQIHCVQYTTNIV